MTIWLFIAIAVLFFVTSAIGVVTGSNSLITVPVMFQLGIDEKVAIATNMFGLTFMAAGGSIPFLRAGNIDLHKIWPLLVVTALGSALGAALVGLISNEGLKLLVSAAMIVVAVFILFNIQPSENTISASLKRPGLMIFLAFGLAIYGGLYSGGYVTVLTAMLVAFSAMPFGEAVGSTKLINLVSSTVATIVFIFQGLVDFWLGSLLAVAMFSGAYAGAHFASRMSETPLKWIFLSTVALLAIKTLYDVLAGSLI